MKAKNLIQIWLTVELKVNGKILAEAITDLNQALGTAYTHSRVREWEENRNGRGERLPRSVRAYMLKIGIPLILKNAGLKVELTTRQINLLAEQCS